MRVENNKTTMGSDVITAAESQGLRIYDDLLSLIMRTQLLLLKSAAGKARSWKP